MNLVTKKKLYKFYQKKSQFDSYYFSVKYSFGGEKIRYSSGIIFFIIIEMNDFEQVVRLKTLIRTGKRLQKNP